MSRLEDVRIFTETRLAFDRRSKYAWALCVVALTAQEVLLTLFQFKATGSEPGRSLLIGLPLFLIAARLRATGWARSAQSIEVVLLLRLTAFAPGRTDFIVPFSDRAGGPRLAIFDSSPCVHACRRCSAYRCAGGWILCRLWPASARASLP